MLSRRSHHGVLTIVVVTSLALAACGRQSPTPATQQPDPPSWFVGEEDRTTPAPPPDEEASLALGDSAIQPATLLVKGGATMRIENTGTGIHAFVLDGLDLAVVEPGESTVVPIDLEPGRYAFWLREDPSITGTLVVT